MNGEAFVTKTTSDNLNIDDNFEEDDDLSDSSKKMSSLSEEDNDFITPSKNDRNFFKFPIVEFY